MRHRLLPLLGPLQLALCVATEEERRLKDDDYYKVINTKTCDGEEKEYGSCGADLKACPACDPVDCKWTDWSPWAQNAVGGCEGICERQRDYKIQNNACGKPCSGTKMSTKKCPVPDSCLSPTLDCKYSEWSAWDTKKCKADKLDQVVRTRNITQNPQRSGKVCEGHLSETKPCSEPGSIVNCKLGSWTSWSTCTKSCGYGLQNRERKISTPSKGEGAPCAGELKEETACNKGPCKSIVDCKVSEWTEWGKCDDSSQQTRHKKVTQAEHGGAPCKASSLKEARACDPTPATDCEMSSWGTWQDCDKTCDGGQRFRQRTVLKPPKWGGKCEGVLSETKPCGTGRCMSPGESDCKLLDWNDWSHCSAPCGYGIKKRAVKGIKKMKNGGKSCKAPMEEMAKCKAADCVKEDCKWEAWDKWEPCTATCGGGFKRRQRSIARAARGGGKACPLEVSAQVTPCSLDVSCTPSCKNGTWGEWGKWGACSATCGSGYQSRSRSPSTVHLPNHCGWAPTGVRDEFAACKGLKPCESDMDCKLSEWNEWGACSGTCFGVRERSRTIKQYATANGKGCNDEPLRVLEPCNPDNGQKAPDGCGTKMPVKDCKMSKWSEWKKCTSKCNGGQKQRVRNILSPPQNNGKPCEPHLIETTSCGMDPCKDPNCEDCTLNDWGEWSACSKEGQKLRTRSVATMPNYCGKKCESSVLSELKACGVEKALERFCAWSEWTKYSPCPTSCSESRARRSRTLSMMMKASKEGYLFKTTPDYRGQCWGSQYESKACDMKKCKPLCTPVDCKITAWTEWSVPMGDGLCQRRRQIETHNNECGKTCFPSNDTEILEQSKACPSNHGKLDCRISEWSTWSNCENPEALRFRMRHVENDPRNGGKPCLNATKETQACFKLHKPIDCSYTQWSSWDTCNTAGHIPPTCGTGFTTRQRRVAKFSSAGGSPCNGAVAEAKSCNGPSCVWKNTTDCEWNHWQEWSECKKNKQEYRIRKIKEATNNGKPCTGEMEQLRECKARDCQLSGWASWSKCTSDCNGMRERTREILIRDDKVGKACANSSLKQAEPCQTKAHAECITTTGCTLDPWSSWGACSATCGFTGQQTRHRGIGSLREIDGIGCTDSTKETRVCKNLKKCKKTDCAWHEWGSWSTCSTSCGTGQKSRSRVLKTAAIGEGAKPCAPEDMQETAACKLKTCPDLKCVDGAWAAWGDWEKCSASCGTGLTWRSRKIAKEANFCGQPVTGPMQQMAACEHKDKSCPKDKDCAFGSWTEWTDCSSTCDGIKRRSRVIETRAVGKGAACDGGMQETAPCKSSVNATGCPVLGVAINCELSKWSGWTPCGAKCGVEQRMRTRKVTVEPQNGGKACDTANNGALYVTAKCDLPECDKSKERKDVDCEWHEWSSWSKCKQCGGVMYRNRRVKAHAEYGGKNCTNDDSGEMAACDHSCFDNVHCMWQSWGEWSKCSISCLPDEAKGKHAGKRTRTRTLKAVVVKADKNSKLWETESSEDIEGQVQELYRRVQAAESRRWQEVSAAFAFGCLSFVSGFGFIALWQRRLESFSRNSRQSPIEPGESQSSRSLFANSREAPTNAILSGIE